MNTIYTVGHGAASSDQLVQLVSEASVTILVDVRSKPYSRWHPQHNREKMRTALAPHAITYLWKGSNLGGLGENTRYAETIAEVAELATSHTVAVLCSEKLPTVCHRRTMLAPHLPSAQPYGRPPSARRNQRHGTSAHRFAHNPAPVLREGITPNG